jgi:hypothetical protein
MGLHFFIDSAVTAELEWILFQSTVRNQARYQNLVGQSLDPITISYSCEVPSTQIQKTWAIHPTQYHTVSKFQLWRVLSSFKKHINKEAYEENNQRKERF